MKKHLVTIFLILLAASPSSRADIWLCVDANNRQSIDDKPCREGLRTRSHVSDAPQTVGPSRPAQPPQLRKTPPKLNPLQPKEIQPELVATGTAFFVSPKLLLTNRHVVQGCNSVRVKDFPKSSVTATDSENDLALISIGENQSKNVASFRSRRVRIGETVTVVGYPLAGLLSGINVTSGNLSSLGGSDEASKLIQMSAPVQPGNSGGPLLDENGNVVGVVVSKLDALAAARLTGDIPQNVNFAIHVDAVRSFLDRKGVQYQLSQSEQRPSIADIADDASRYTVLVGCFN